MFHETVDKGARVSSKILRGAHNIVRFAVTTSGYIKYLTGKKCKLFFYKMKLLDVQLFRLSRNTKYFLPYQQKFDLLSMCLASYNLRFIRQSAWVQIYDESCPWKD